MANLLELMMTERPFLILPTPTDASRAKKFGGGDQPKPLTQGRQQERLGPRLVELERAFEARRVRLQLQTADILPERVLVLETAGTVDEFYRAVSRIDGMEFLGEYDQDDLPPDEDFHIEKNGKREGYRGRVYLTLTNMSAYRELLGLWRTWQQHETMRHGLSRWRSVFELLRDIRPWSINDRLEETGVLADWRERLTWQTEAIPCEIELWYRHNPALRQQASAAVREQVTILGGRTLSETTIEDIRYHAMAVQLPILAVQRLLDTDDRQSIELVQAEQIQFFRASGQMIGRIAVGDGKLSVPDLVGPIPEQV